MLIKIFIDAQIFLDFYRLKAVIPLLQPLIQITDYILVTRQVVNEVYRNKADAACEILKDDTNKIQFKTTLPGTFIAQALVIAPDIETKITQIRDKTKSINSELGQIQKDLAAIYSQTLEDVSKGRDKVSLTLEKIFQKAIEHTEPQFNIAKRRKDLGNPPGKLKDPIGDELNWEQILDYSQKEKCSIWIVSRDKDFYAKSINSQVFANPFLQKEISDRGLPEFCFFNELSSPLAKFKDSQMSDLDIPTEAELKNASEAQTKKSTPLFDECNGNHTARVYRDGRFDILYCTVCKKSLGAQISDCE